MLFIGSSNTCEHLAVTHSFSTFAYPTTCNGYEHFSILPGRVFSVSSFIYFYQYGKVEKYAKTSLYIHTLTDSDEFVYEYCWPVFHFDFYGKKSICPAIFYHFPVDCWRWWKLLTVGSCSWHWLLTHHALTVRNIVCNGCVKKYTQKKNQAIKSQNNW